MEDIVGQYTNQSKISMEEIPRLYETFNGSSMEISLCEF